MGSALSVYAINRRDAECHDEAIDVLETAWRVMRGRPGELLAGTAEAKYLVRAGRLDDGKALYDRLGRSGSPDALLHPRLGRADVLHAAGKPKAAARCYRRLLPDAQRARYEALATDAEIGLIRALLAQGHTREAALRAWQLRERHIDRAQPELSRALEALGALEAAARLQAQTALGYPPLGPRRQALASLARIATRQDDHLAFERWRRVGERFHEDRLPSPSFELDFWLELARGAAWFARPEVARHALDTGEEVAERATAPDAETRLRAAEADVAQRRGPAPTASGPPADEELERVLAAVAALGEPSQWATLVSPPLGTHGS